MYWHNFKIEKILKYLSINYYKLPIYIILNYVDETDLNNFMLNKFQKYYLVMAAFQCLIIAGKILLNTKIALLT